MENGGSGRAGEPAKAASRFGGAMLGGVSAVAVLAVLAGLWVWRNPPEPGPDAALTPPVAAPEPASEVAKLPEPAAAPVPPAPAAASTQAPASEASFDQFRAAPDGAITLAGRAEPGAKVEVLLDGVVVDSVTAEAGGSFASVVLAEPSSEPRLVTVRVTGADGIARDGGESVTVAPSPAAVATAAAAAGASQEAVADQVAAAEALAETPLVTDAQGARVLADAGAEMVIDTVSFGAGAQISISGRGAPAEALLRAYIDNAEAGLVQAGPDGAWRMVLPAGEVGAHMLRIDALDAEGKVLARAETGYDRVAPEALAGAPAAGADGATPGVRQITIEKGNTLWAIARDTYGDPYLFVRLYEANRDQIRDPDLIYPGQVFTIPE